MRRWLVAWPGRSGFSGRGRTWGAGCRRARAGRWTAGRLAWCAWGVRWRETKEPCGMSNETCLRTARREAPLWYSLVRSLAESIQSMRAGFGVAALLLAACGGAVTKANARPAPVESTTVAASGATSAADAAAHTGVPRVLFLGTSLTAGY